MNMVILSANSPPDKQKRKKMIGKHLQELRVKHKITQLELSKATGVERGLISKFENGRAMSKSIQVLFELYFEKLARNN